MFSVRPQDNLCTTLYIHVNHCDILYFRTVSFDIDLYPWSGDDCESTIDTFHEGVELSVRRVIDNISDTEWIPLLYITRSSSLSNNEGESQTSISITNDDNITHMRNGSFVLRGYTVPYLITNGSRQLVSLCGEGILEDRLQLRWLQMSRQYPLEQGESDVIILDNITISVYRGHQPTSLFEENFDDTLSTGNR